MQLPVVFVHQGNQKYLRDVIRLAQKRNELVYLIGDLSNKNYCSKRFNMQTFSMERFKIFSENYFHMSTNPYNFELNCFRRFYLLKEFMALNNLESCMLLDSDLCVYTTFVYEDYRGYDVALSM